ncbi:HNH endonuclease signature motif containing protein, partial [Cellulomonas sp.]|uniref:HNH endonuclease signature motif containing protein n=1 Tax=Cellulomonas sp. TaxID=40001 RepID=UPI002D3FE0B8
GPVLDAWLRGLDQRVVSPTVLVEVVAAIDRMESHLHARKLAAVAELASREEMRPDWSPLAGAPPTQTSVAGDELAMRLGWARMTANRVVRRAVVLDGLLGATQEALEAGHVDAAKAEVLAAALTDQSFQVAHAVEDAVLPDAGQCSVAELRQRVQREIRLADPDGAADRHERARCTRRVTHPRAQADGMASMWLVLAAEDATRVDGVLDHAARAAKAVGDGRTLDQLRADGLRDLVVGDVPASDGPAFEVRLDPPAPALPNPRRSAEDLSVSTFRLVPRPPVEPVPTGTLVPLDATTLEPAPGAAPTPLPATAPPPAYATAPDPPSADTAPTAPTTAPPPAPAHATAPAPLSTGTSSTAPGTPSTTTGTASATTGTRATAPGTRATAAGAAPTTGHRTCTRCSGRPGAEVRITINASTLIGLDDQPADLEGHGPIDAVRARALAVGGVWRRLVTDPVTHRLLDVGRERYRPPAALDEFVRTRDGTCVAPGCVRPACGCELDHTEEFHPQPGADPDAPLGRTDADNLGPLCHRHHRLKTDGGFRLRQIEPGLFEWLTPTGHRYLTRPGTGQNHDATADPHDEPPPF